MNIRDVLLEMRKYRMGLIQTEFQLKFSYLAIAEGARQHGHLNLNILSGSNVIRIIRVISLLSMLIIN